MESTPGAFVFVTLLEAARNRRNCCSYLIAYSESSFLLRCLFLRQSPSLDSKRNFLYLLFVLKKVLLDSVILVMAESLFWTLLELLLPLTAYLFIFISRKRCWFNVYVITAAIFISIESTPSPGIQCLAVLLSGLSNWGRYCRSYLCGGTFLFRKYPWSSYSPFSFVFLSLESTALPVLSWAMFLSWMKASTSV